MLNFAKIRSVESFIISIPRDTPFIWARWVQANTSTSAGT
jgi:hypothetical protein